MIVEFTIRQPTLLQSLREIPSTEIRWEQTDTMEDGEQLLLFWAESDDYDAFETAMGDDPTVSAPRCLIEFVDRRLYQVEQTGEGSARSVYSAMVEAGGIIQSCTATHDGWEVQARFPDNDALSHFHDACTTHDIDFQLLKKYQESDDEDHSDGYGLTTKQRRMLTHAVEQGYYEVPRQSDLESIADDRGISHQAASERLRRAVSVLARNALSLPPASDEKKTAPQERAAEPPANDSETR